MIEIKNLTKAYGTKKAIDNISFTVNSGEILGFLGPNGAGKTTTMNIITGYNGATSGTVTVDGLDTVENPMECRRKIGYLPELPPLYMDMTVSEYLNFVFELKKPDLDCEEHLDEIMEIVKIKDVSGRLIKNLSKGYKQRVGIAQALIGNPEILILDEPTVGLDPKQIIEIRNVIRDLGKDRTIILSSHILPEVSAICERVIIINEGKIMAIDTPDNLSAKLSGENKLLIRVEGKEKEVTGALRGVDGISGIECVGEVEEGTCDFVVSAKKGADVRKKVFSALAKADMPILMSKAAGLSLEDIFLKLTTDESKEAKKSKKEEDKN
ncbi:MAG: ATP-binding cassette domain-containing protein [Clostridia bacterium]|nr:ATP-binding cassette domain-containing protein [Clostridia bacterium]